jgi:hypothetical protein
VYKTQLITHNLSRLKRITTFWVALYRYHKFGHKSVGAKGVLPSHAAQTGRKCDILGLFEQFTSIP